MILKKCRSKVSYFSEKLNDFAPAIYVSEKNNLCFIQNSFEKIWIDKSKIKIIE